jgi:hypothetical protein
LQLAIEIVAPRHLIIFLIEHAESNFHLFLHMLLLVTTKNDASTGGFLVTVYFTLDYIQ